MKSFPRIGSFVFVVLLAWVGALPTLGAVAFAPPVVVVYPLTIAGALASNSAGADVALILATKIAEAGGVTVRPYTPGTVRAEYLDAALKSKADYYVTGFLQPIGEDVSMIVQVVSTHSGSVVFSNTTTIRTFSDAMAEADPLREAILRHAGRGLAALEAQPVAPAPSTAPSSGQGVNLTRALRRRQQATPTPSPSPSSDAGLVPVAQIERNFATGSPSPRPRAAVVAQTTQSPTASPAPAASSPPAPTPVPLPVATPTAEPTPTPTPTPNPTLEATPLPQASPGPQATPTPTVSALPPTPTPLGSSTPGRVGTGRRATTASPASPTPVDSTVLVIDTAGDEALQDRLDASAELVASLRKRGIHAARLPIVASDAIKSAADICRVNVGASRFYAPTLVLGHDDKGDVLAKLSVQSVDCTGVVVGRKDASASASSVPRVGTTATAAAIRGVAEKMAPSLSGS